MIFFPKGADTLSNLEFTSGPKKVYPCLAWPDGGGGGVREDTERVDQFSKLTSFKLTVKKSKCFFPANSAGCIRRAMEADDRLCLWLPALPGMNKAGTPLTLRG
jgi:hypothetical protein